MNQRPYLVVIAVLLLSNFSPAQAVADLQQPMSIDIPAQGLLKALKDLEWQINVDIICASDLCRAVKAPPCVWNADGGRRDADTAAWLRSAL